MAIIPMPIEMAPWMTWGGQSVNRKVNRAVYAYEKPLPAGKPVSTIELEHSSSNESGERTGKHVSCV